MNKFFAEYTDLTALAITLFLPLLLTIFIKRKTGRRARAVAVYFSLFGPAGILAFISLHLFENSYHAVEHAVQGTFKYDFHFYSIILLGAVIAVTGGSLLRACWQKCTGNSHSNHKIFLCIALILLVCVPLFPITPISAAPVFCCIISLPAIFFVRRRMEQTEKDIQQNETIGAMV